MLLLLLEALGALLVFILIIWWTMFSGRKRGELPGAHGTDAVAEPSPDEAAKKAR
jgi:hypothetical protein